MFIVFEGADGAGKSTQVKLLTEGLTERGIDTIAVREPGGTPAGEAVREIMFGREPPLPMRPLTWAFLMNAARAELVAEVVAPALRQGCVVIADRYWYSTMAYQGAGDGVDADVIRRLSRIATTGLEPDLVILFDVPAAEAMERKRSGSRDVLDRRPLDYHERVVQAYRGLAARDPDRWHVLDGLEPPEALAQAVLEEVLIAIDAQTARAYS
ncbi:MAG TPA: dTMP kinase [Chloroflexota bacterium]|jgi:dTMP kinase|nr:dTMP kinase [Chloroflexota bacterium]